MSMLVADIEKRYSGDTVIRAAMHRPADRFSVTILFGPSGCGKTTLLRCLAGLERPEAGQVRFGDERWFDADSRVFVQPQQRDVGFLFQDFALFPHMNVESNIGYGLHGVSRSERNSRVGELIAMLQLRGLEKRMPSRLSGGEQQRVALARAVIRRPRLLMLDEPLSALDAPTREELRRELRSLLSTFGIPCMIVTHDRFEALALGDHALVMEQGRVLQQGPIDEVFSKPADARVARMVGVETVLSARIASVDDGLLILEVGKARLLAIAPERLAGTLSSVHLCIRGEDVTLQQGIADGTSSARNHLPARVTAIDAEGVLMRISLDAGFPLVALITRNAAATLGLREGSQVTAQIKAPAIHVIAR